MDPKALNHLDPKARETYDRIMGTAHDVAGTTPGDTPVNTPTPADSVMPPNPAVGDVPPTTDLSSPASDPLVNASDPNSVLSTSPNASPITDPTLSNTMPAPEPAAPPIMDTFDQVSASPATTPEPADPSATLFASDAPAPVSEPTSSSSFGSASGSPSAFFNNPAPAPTESQPDLASPQAFSSLDSSQANPPDTDPMAPVTPYNPSPGDPQAQVFTQPLPSPAEVSQANAPHETSALLRVLYIVGAVVFFAIYTVFWIKVFNLPFLF